MSKIAVVYWSGTGNTEAMANEVAEGAKEKGAMGAENLEESEFEPMFTECEGSLSGKKIALFGSYGWGSGEWMDDWAERCKNAGADIVTAPVICNEAPDDDAKAECRKLGAAMV